jgi:multiple sugar transport system permease protein
MAAGTINRRTPTHINTSPAYAKQMRSFGLTASVSLFTLLLVLTFLMPFGYMTVTALKDREQITAGARGPILPMDTETFEYEGRRLDVYNVPFEDGIRQLALFQPGRQESTFIDPDAPEAGPIVWQGAWRTLQPAQYLSPRWGNFQAAWDGVAFPLLMRNTLAIAVLGLIGTLLSSIMVAYAFARFPIPGKRIIFLILISTIILPRQVTLVPTYAFFSLIGWTGTWLPLIVPHFFANAYNVFLLRQYFLTLPRELDEAAMIDGAGPLRILWSVIIPQSWPVIVAVGLFHFVFAWNDYFEPLIYLLGRPELQPISVGIQRFNFIFDTQPHLIQATALLGLTLPVIIFFFAQRVFMRGVVITGVEK